MECNMQLRTINAGFRLTTPLYCELSGRVVNLKLVYLSEVWPPHFILVFTRSDNSLKQNQSPDGGINKIVNLHLSQLKVSESPLLRESWL